MTMSSKCLLRMESQHCPTQADHWKRKEVRAAADLLSASHFFSIFRQIVLHHLLLFPTVGQQINLKKEILAKKRSVSFFYRYLQCFLSKLSNSLHCGSAHTLVHICVCVCMYFSAPPLPPLHPTVGFQTPTIIRMVPRGQHSDAAELPEEDSGVDYAQIQHMHAPVLKSMMNPDRERTLRWIRARTQPTDDTSFGVSHLPATSCQGLQGKFSLTSVRAKRTVCPMNCACCIYF